MVLIILKIILVFLTTSSFADVILKEAPANGENHVGFSAPDSIGTDVIWTLPTGDGTSSQVLTTDGAGNLSWTTVSGGSSPWTDSGGNIYFNTGNIGIGTATPTTKLDVSGAIRTPVDSNGATRTIDFSTSNIQASTSNCDGTAWTLNNLYDGGTYTLAVENTTHSGSCIFSGSGVTNWYFRPANTTPVVGNVLYTLQRIGNNVYVTWVEGFN